MRSVSFLAGVAAVLLLVTSPNSVTAQDKPPPPAPEPKVDPATFDVTQSWTGFDSAIASREYTLATNADELAALWLRHAPERIKPRLNFDKEMLMAVFSGSGYEAEVKISQIFVGRRYYIEVKCGDKPKEPSAKPLTPYGMFVLPKVLAPIVIQELYWPDREGPGWYTLVKTFQPDGPLLKQHEWWPIKHWAGKDSELGREDGKSEVVATSGSEEWARLWKLHSPKTKPPALPGMVVLSVFAGNTKNGKAVVMDDLLISKDFILLRFHRESDTVAKEEKFSKPFGMFVLPDRNDPSEAEYTLLFEELESTKIDENGTAVPRTKDDPPRYEAVPQSRIHISEYKKKESDD